MSGVERIAAERARQVERFGATGEWDVNHDQDELARAAAAYALPAWFRDQPIFRVALRRFIWPDGYNGQRWDWSPSPDDRIRELEKAGALIAAEIDRLLAAYSVAAGAAHEGEKA